jgi:hypothetical protein
MEVQPDIQQRSGLDQASSLGASSACPDTGRMWLQLIQRSEPKVGSTARALTHLHLLLVIVIPVSTSG